MDWIIQLFTQHSVAQAVLVYSLTIIIGVLIGQIQIKGVSIGIAGVLFAGIFFSHFGLRIDEHLLHFIKEFGLVLFVFMVGLQVGVSFFSSFRQEGLSLNLLAISLVALGIITTLIVYYITGVSPSVMVGIMSGAVTNTPGLGAAQQTLSDIAKINPDFKYVSPALAYAITYPMGVLGLITSIILIKVFFKIDINKEREALKVLQQKNTPVPEHQSFLVQNPQLFGKTIYSLSELLPNKVIISRLFHKNKVVTPTANMILNENDIIMAVGMQEELDKLILIVGNLSEKDLFEMSGELITRNILVTKNIAIGKTISELQLRSAYGVNITRLQRGGLQLLASANNRLHFGDRLLVVGTEADIERVTKFLGNSQKHLEHPNVLALFIGIILGAFLGSIPIYLPSLPAPIKLGLAGGPLIVAIILSRIGQIGKLNMYVSNSANLMVREIGILLFLASIGLQAGENFVDTIVNGDGFSWFFYGLMITFIPDLIIGVLARVVFKKNYLEICGLLAGACSSPPTLAFTTAFTQSDKPSFVYATVFPLVTFCRILAAQLMVLLLS